MVARAMVARSAARTAARSSARSRKAEVAPALCRWRYARGGDARLYPLFRECLATQSENHLRRIKRTLRIVPYPSASDLKFRRDTGAVVAARRVGLMSSPSTDFTRVFKRSDAVLESLAAVGLAE